MKLTPGQEIALKAILENEESFALHGAAGTGKTTVLQIAAKKMDLKKIVFLAPTNQALEVLSSKLPKRARARTVQGFLGMEMETVEDKQVYKLTKTGIAKACNYAINDYIETIIIDESSMVDAKVEKGLDEVWSVLNQIRDFRIIWSGDKYQLPPVSGERCLSFWEPKYAVELKEVVRHAGPVLAYSTNIRENFSIPAQLPKDCVTESGSIATLQEELWTESLIREIKINGLGTRCLCWQNASVTKISRQIRVELFGTESLAQPFMEGEPVRFNQRYSTKDSLRGRFNNSAEAVVVSVEKVNLEPSDFPFQEIVFEYVTKVKGLKTELRYSPSVPAYKLCLRRIDSFTGKPKGDPIDNVYVKQPGTDFDEKIGEIATAIRRAKKNDYIYDKKQEKKAWDSINAIKGQFAKLGSAYVMTVHKSQGSTFNTTFVYKDIWLIKESEVHLRNSMTYTANTRSSKSTIFCNL